MVGNQLIDLLPGQFIFGRQAAAAELRQTERNIRTCLSILEKSGNLTIKTTNKYSVVTITNWGIYQSESVEIDQQNDQTATNNRPTTGQQPATNKNGKNGKNGKNEKNVSTKDRRRRNPDYLILAQKLRDLCLTHKPFANGLDPVLDGYAAWANEIGMLVEVDGHPPPEIEALMAWAVTDAFWAENCRSPAAMRGRTRRGDRTRWEVIEAAMKQGDRSEKDQRGPVGHKFDGFGITA